MTRDARKLRDEKIFPEIAAGYLPEAEEKAKKIEPAEVLGLVLGARAEGPAFAQGGVLRFDIGRFLDGRFVPVPGPLLYIWDETRLRFPATQKHVEVYAHYTPITRRVDYFVVHAYYSYKLTEEELRPEIMRLADAVKSSPLGGKIDVSVKMLKHVADYLVKTKIALKPLVKLSDEESRKIAGLLAGTVSDRT